MDDVTPSPDVGTLGATQQTGAEPGATATPSDEGSLTQEQITEIKDGRARAVTEAKRLDQELGQMRQQLFASQQQAQVAQQQAAPVPTTGSEISRQQMMDAVLAGDGPTVEAYEQQAKQSDRQERANEQAWEQQGAAERQAATFALQRSVSSLGNDPQMSQQLLQRYQQLQYDPQHQLLNKQIIQNVPGFGQIDINTMRAAAEGLRNERGAVAAQARTAAQANDTSYLSVPATGGETIVPGQSTANFNPMVHLSSDEREGVDKGVHSNLTTNYKDYWESLPASNQGERLRMGGPVRMKSRTFGRRPKKVRTNK